MDEAATLSPDDAFALLGNETRIGILQALGGADDPVSFSDLRDSVGMRDTGQFNYHLDKVVGHFVRRTDDGYSLRRAGERVIEAVLSGAVTDAPVLEPTVVDHPCPLCGAPIKVTFREERVEMYCTECPGSYGWTDAEDFEERADSEVPTGGYLGYHPLPPAGVTGRTANEVIRAALTWGHLELLSASSGVCPRCGAALDHRLYACDAHDAADGLCDACERRHAGQVTLRCTNCIYDEVGAAAVGLASATPLLAFLTSHGYNPVDPVPGDHPTLALVFTDYDEEVRETDPPEVRFTFTADGDELALTVDETLSVVDVDES